MPLAGVPNQVCAQCRTIRIEPPVTDRAHMAGYMAVRDHYVAQPPPASTLVIVTGFTRPEFKVEVEAIAAKAADGSP